MTENDKKAIEVLREFNQRRVKLAGEIVRLRIENEQLRNGRGPDDPTNCPADNFDSCCGYHDACREALEGTS